MILLKQKLRVFYTKILYKDICKFFNFAKQFALNAALVKS